MINLGDTVYFNLSLREEILAQTQTHNMENIMHLPFTITRIIQSDGIPYYRLEGNTMVEYFKEMYIYKKGDVLEDII